MTNHWIDIKNSRTIMVLGANPVENHPVVSQYINEAISQGARLIVADPRRTRTAILAENTGGIFLRMRPGTNGALLAGLMNYLITNNQYDAVYQTATAGRAFTDANGAKNNVTVPKWTDALFKLNPNRTDYQRDLTSGMPVMAANLNDADSVFQVLKARVASYTPAVVADICDIPGGANAFIAFAQAVAASHGDSSIAGGLGGSRGAKFPGTVLYAMGGTQYTHAAQDLRAFSMLQCLLGNMGRPGGGVNALRGIHNVQGSTDMGVLFDSVPGYSGNAAVGQGYDNYMDKLFGGARVANSSGNYWWTTDPWNGDAKYSGWNLQQHGFRNMMHHWFHQAATPVAADDYSAAPTTITNRNYDLVPKGNGLHHIQMFQKAAATEPDTTRVKCMFILGQNPAVTEPNLKLVRDGLRDLDTLVLVDMFENETAGCDRKGTGVTYLLPSCSFVEEEGSVTNSGRTLAWRYKAINPQGGTKADLEILLRLAKKLDEAGAFNHIPLSESYTDRYAQLYGDWTSATAKSGYGWTPGTDFNAVAADVAERIFIQMGHGNISSAPFSALWIYRGSYGGWAGVGNAASAPGATNYYLVAPTSITAVVNSTTISVADATQLKVGDTCYIGTGSTMEMATIVSKTGNDITIQTGLAANSGLKYTHAAGEPVGNVANRAKSRGMIDCGHAGAPSTLGLYSNWGWAWLKNRRVFYNNGEVPGDVSDNFVAPDMVARYFVHNASDNAGMPPVVQYASSYRAYSTLKDRDSATGAYAKMPKHWETVETARGDLKTAYGTTGDAPTGAIGTVNTYPLTLTTIRVTEHFQGGVISRNVPWLCELVPDAFIELSSYDAVAKGIVNGDNVQIQTNRQPGVWIGPFKARVSAGAAAQQMVKKGVVAIPWHWGNKGISTGPSANELTIDALDTNVKMPEYKTCLCQIRKQP
jgi:anaerobic selenocysteine-containing dehydrogenase